MSPSSISPIVQGFFDSNTNTVSYLVIDPKSKHCAIIDSVLDYDAASSSTDDKSAVRILKTVEEKGLTVDWHLETHVHADHLSAAPYIQSKLGGKIAIGEHICTVQETFSGVFNCEPEFKSDGSQFNHLFKDQETFAIGQLECSVIHTPGHTPACVSYRIGDALFVGDTFFMPDYGTARCDFPGGDAAVLYQSIHKLLQLPPQTKVYLCHDYLPVGRQDFCWETTIGKQQQNIHIDNVNESDFVTMRQQRDATLSMPKLILPSVQINMRAGHLPPAESNGCHYLKIPMNVL